VTVDVDGVGEPPDGSVDSAFRIQRPRVLVDYQGPARVGYALGELVIEALDGATHVFGFKVAPATGGTLSNGSLATAVGIARFWEPDVHDRVDDVQAGLLSPFCGGGLFTDAAAGCGSCDPPPRPLDSRPLRRDLAVASLGFTLAEAGEGGPGSFQCELPEPGGSCEAVCAEEYFACCNYPGECRCCANIERR
jgi:hypothetical protein